MVMKFLLVFGTGRPDADENMKRAFDNHLRCIKFGEDPRQGEIWLGIIFTARDLYDAKQSGRELKRQMQLEAYTCGLYQRRLEGPTSGDLHPDNWFRVGEC